MVSETILLAAMICSTAMLTALGGIVTVMGGLYFTTAMKQQEMNVRENLRTSKALARIELEAGQQQTGGGNDLMSLAAQFLPMIMGRKASESQQEVEKNEQV